HPSIRVHSQENIDSIVSECPAIVRMAHRLARIIGKNVWQQFSRDGRCVLRRITARVLQFVREHTNEAIIICRFPAEVRLPLLSNEENGLHWSSTTICLDPAAASFVHCASPNSHLIVSQIRVRQFNYDAANILVIEEVVSRELHVVEIAVDVEKERIAAPTEEKPIIVGVRHQSFSPD